MLNNSYFIIYNNSFDIMYKNLNFYINDKKEDFKKNYELKNSKKITGYMLFVRDYYKKSSDKKKISNIWKTLDIEKKKEYDTRAKKILGIYNKYINKKEEPKKKEKNEEIIEEIIEEKIEEKNYILKKIEYEGKKYYIDYYENLIDIDKEKYVGYKRNNKIHFYK